MILSPIAPPSVRGCSSPVDDPEEPVRSELPPWLPLAPDMPAHPRCRVDDKLRDWSAVIGVGIARPHDLDRI